MTEYVACTGNIVRTCRAGETVRTSPRGIANKAKAEPEHRFRNLHGMIDKELPLDSWKHLNKKAAPGGDRVTAQEYAQDLESNMERLVESLEEKRYRAKPIGKKASFTFLGF